MSANRIIDCCGLSVVHELSARAETPQRRRPDLVVSVRTAILNNRIRGSDIVQKKVAEWMNCFVSERGRHCKGTAIDRRPNRCSRYGWYVTGGAADSRKKVHAGLVIRVR